MTMTKREAAERLALRDRLDDLLTGLEFWQEKKVASGELTVLDEVLIRWTEAGPVYRPEGDTA